MVRYYLKRFKKTFFSFDEIRKYLHEYLNPVCDWGASSTWDIEIRETPKQLRVKCVYTDGHARTFICDKLE